MSESNASGLVASYTNAMRIPHLLLSPAALRAVIEEFVTRDGTDNSALEPRIAKILLELDTHSLALHFNEQTETCNILPVGVNEAASAADGAE